MKNPISDEGRSVLVVIIPELDDKIKNVDFQSSLSYIKNNKIQLEYNRSQEIFLTIKHIHYPIKYNNYDKCLAVDLFSNVPLKKSSLVTRYVSNLLKDAIVEYGVYNKSF